MREIVNEVSSAYSIRIKSYSERSKKRGESIMAITKQAYEELKAQGVPYREYTTCVIASHGEFDPAIWKVRQVIFQHEIVVDKGHMTNF